LAQLTNVTLLAKAINYPNPNQPTRLITRKTNFLLRAKLKSRRKHKRPISKQFIFHACSGSRSREEKIGAVGRKITVFGSKMLARKLISQRRPEMELASRKARNSKIAQQQTFEPPVRLLSATYLHFSVTATQKRVSE